MGTRDGEEFDETIDADPALLAELRDRAAKRQHDVDEHSPASDAPPDEETIGVDPALLAELHNNAANRQPSVDEPPTDGDPPPDDETIDADPALLAELRNNAGNRHLRSDEDPDEHTAPADSPDEHTPLEEQTVASLDSAVASDAASPAEATEPPAVEQDDSAERTTATVPRKEHAATAASAFVREAKQASANTSASNQTADEAPKKRRNGLAVLLAVIVGAQILAVGVFFSLRALQGDEDPVDEVATQVDGDQSLDVVQPTPIPAGATAVPINATPTPVPPTPEWRPTNEGPRTNPFNYSVEAIVNTPVYLDGPGGNEVTPRQANSALVLENPRPSGEPLVFQVAEGTPGDDWARIRLAGSDDEVWIDATEFTWRSSNTSMQVDISVNLIRIFEGNNILYIGSVASGRLDAPTLPVVTYAVEDPLTNSDGRTVIELAAVDGSSRPLRVELAEGSIAGDGYVTDGTVQIMREAANAISEHLVAGSTVEFLGTPPRPTPTPVPTPTRQPLGSSSRPPSSGSSGCPQDGTPPNCYRVVDRESVPGECESYQVEIDNSCLLFAGDTNEIDPNAPICPVAAPDQIGARCYKRIGPVPEIPGDCPPRSREVDGECRI